MFKRILSIMTNVIEKIKLKTNNQNVMEPTVIQEMLEQFPDVMIHLDGGHAKLTLGKRSPWSAKKIQPELDFYEYEWNRLMVSLIKEELEKYGIKVHIVTPEIDEDIPLKTRYTRANDMKTKHPELKHLFISVHSNAHGDGSKWTSAQGWSCYTTKGQNTSDKLAECLYDAAEEILPQLNKKIRTDCSDGDRDWEENFTVIKGTTMPSVLTENMFYTNIEDTKFLLSEEGQKAIRDIHVNGILKYIKKYLNANVA